MSFNYFDPANHIRSRAGLSDEIKTSLLGTERESWSHHPKYGGSAAFFIQIHGSLKQGADQLRTGLQTVLDAPEDGRGEVMSNLRLQAVSRQLISFAHGHHHIEDHHYFPQFERILPNISNAIALLDGDHRALETGLGEAEQAMTALRQGPVSTDGIAKAMHKAEALEKILQRHLNDEEEIIIPIFLIAS